MAKRTLNDVKKLDKSQPRKGKRSDSPQCGLCGKTENLTKTECCDNWICDDEDQYRLFSFAHNSCSRNHRRYTLCGGHYAEKHPGRWQECQQCRELFETEMYVYSGTNEYNFEKLANPPKYEPTHCTGCKRIIRLGYDGYSYGPEGYLCEKCNQKKFGDLLTR
ncbi:hypothetical protein LEP3755_62600 (plasmid) [Leptolyngbya sp. NIES-3755]|nr:hypothetical protein LEP3755_62600 [Leptolyngbya sp. NIES-3755]